MVTKASVSRVDSQVETVSGMWYDVGCERKRRIKDNSKDFGLGNWEGRDARKRDRRL